MADTLLIRPISAEDLPAVAEMENAAWHNYYSQYPFYQTIKDSVSVDGLLHDWAEFLDQERETSGAVVVGSDRRAYVALLNGKIAGVGALSSYVQGKWPVVDELLRLADGRIRKTVKFQELYVRPDIRGSGIGHYLTIARADYALERGYEAIFLTTYAEADRTTEFHQKNGLKKVHEYLSFQTYNNGEKAKIGCFLNTDLSDWRRSMQAKLQQKVAKGAVIPEASIIL